VKVSHGPERVSVAEADALLYLPGHPRAQLERALRIPALGAGWRRSFEALLTQRRSGGATTGNAGLTAAAGPPPAWQGFRQLRVSRKVHESSNVISLMLESADKEPLAAALPGQFVVLRLRPAADAPVLMRSYSLSGEPSAERYRVSVKREAHGAAGIYIDDELQVGDVVNASAARGSFTLRPGNTPVVLLSAGIGATPVLAMLHALAAQASTREIWWLYGARSGREHPFAEETRSLLKVLRHSHGHIRYSAPDPEDRLGKNFDASGRLNMRALEELSLPRSGDFYICGPSTFMSDLTAGLVASGVARSRIHTEIFGALLLRRDGCRTCRQACQDRDR
jgi:ferredoxin-NADP reductase